MRVVTIKKKVMTGWTMGIAVSVVALLCFFSAPAQAYPVTATASVIKVLPAATRTVTVEKTQAAILTVTATSTVTATVTQTTVEKSVLTKIEGSQFTTGFIVAGLMLTLLGFWLAFLLGYRDGNEYNKGYVEETLRQIKER